MSGQYGFIACRQCGLKVAFIPNYGVSLADVYAALAYYYDHRQEIDEAILADESYVAELRNRIPSKLSQKIGG